MKNWIKTHKALAILTIIFGPFVLLIMLIMFVGIIGGIAGVKNAKPAQVSNTSNPAPQKAVETKAEVKPVVLAKVGEAVRDGKFEFVVNSIECGRTSVGTNEFLTKQAQGQFCLLSMTAKNIGNQAQSFDGSSQYLYDASGANFSSGTSASLYANPDGGTFYNQINPGNSVTGVVVFDISKDRTPIKAELHDSAFSGGVKVELQ
jgi:Na+-transporting methylmalonyl-CoA/oxaloacetate decarboxylase gamma subunit